MPARLCSHTNTGGLPCRAVALANSSLCRAHHRLDQRSRRIERYRRPPAIRLGPLADAPSTQRALSRVLQTLASGSPHLERLAGHLERIRLASGVPACGPHPMLGIELPGICSHTRATLQSTKPAPPDAAARPSHRG